MKRTVTGMMIALTLLVLVGGLSGCGKEEGTAEEAGKKADEAATQAQDAANEAGDKLKDVTGQN